MDHQIADSFGGLLSSLLALHVVYSALILDFTFSSLPLAWSVDRRRYDVPARKSGKSALMTLSDVGFSIFCGIVGSRGARREI